MALRQRNFFFDPTNTDRFNSQDIPTEQTMSDWCDSVPFIKEPTDRAQLTRAGIAKTTSDAKINAGDNTDASGVSSLGFTTFVRPAQIPKILDSPSVTWTKVPRGGANTTDTGVGIEDWQANIDLDAIPESNTSNVVLDADKSVRIITGSFPCGTIDVEVTTPAGDPLSDYLNDLRAAINQANQTIISISNNLCTLNANSESQVEVGDVVMSTTSPNTWNDKWAEPAGQPLLIADHSELYAIFGSTYGVSPSPSTHFLLPDMVTEQNYLKVRQFNGLLMPPLNNGIVSKILVENDLPEHTHTVNGTATGGEHSHTFPVHEAQLGFTVVDGNGGDPDFNNYTTPLGGGHSHTVTGTTDPFGQNPPNPVWNTATTNNTPRYTNVYLKMRVKP